MLITELHDAPRFIVMLDAREAGSAELIRIPIAITGTWTKEGKTFEITRDDLEAICRNFARRGNGEINVDYDHASEMPEVARGGPVPSAGRLVKLDAPKVLNGTGRLILYGYFAPTPKARELIRNGEYRSISPAIDWAASSKDTGKPQGATLTSVALTNRPFLEELPQIQLSDPSYRLVGESEGVKMSSDSNRSFRGAQLRFVAACEARMREAKASFRQALTEVARERPDLAEAARREAISGEPAEGFQPREPWRFSEPRPQPAQEELIHLTEARAKERGLTFCEALSEIGRERPELAERARQEALRG